MEFGWRSKLGQDGTLLSSHQEGHQKGQQYRSDLEFKHVFFDKPYEQEVMNTVKIEDHASTTGVGTTYRGSNGELVSYKSSAEFKEDKQFISDMTGQVYENRTGGANDTQDNKQEDTTPERYLRLYPSSEGNIIAQFERDPNRDDLPEEGAWKFIAEVQNSQKQNTRFIASPGMTLQILSGGNQEKLWALTSANPSYLATDDLGGQEVIIPYAYTGLQLNASNHGFQTSSNYIKGSSVPSAPAPLAPEPGREGGFKRFVPGIVMLAVCIVAQRYLVAAGQAAGLVAAATTTATALTTQQAIGLMAITAVSVAAGNAAGQLTAKEMYPELYEGFDWNSVGESAILGALMAGTQSTLWNGMGVSAANSTSTIEKMAYAMTQAATTYATNYAFQKVNGRGSFDLRGLMGTMVSAGLTRGLLTEFGLNEKEYDSLLKQVRADMFFVIGGGLSDALFAAAFSNTPVNPELMTAMGLGRMVGRTISYGAPVVFPPAQSNAPIPQGTERRMQDSQSELVFEESGQHQTRVPNQIASRQTNSQGYARSVNDAVSDTVPINPTPRQKARMTMMFDEQVKKASFGNGQRKTSYGSYYQDNNDILNIEITPRARPRPSLGNIPEDLTYGEAINNGLTNVVNDMYNMVAHPIDSALGVLKGATGALKMVGTMSTFMQDNFIANAYKNAGLAVPPEVLERLNQGSGFLLNTTDGLVNMTGPQRAQWATEMVVGGVLGGGVAKGAHYLYKAGRGGGFFGGGTVEDGILSSGGRQIKTVDEHFKLEEEAIDYYEHIRSSPSNYDVTQIAKNTGMPEYKVQRIKNHLFFEEHIRNGKVKRFDSDIEVSDAWRRLQTDKFYQEDLNLLNHEYFESKFEGIFKTNYTTAHNAANDSGRIWDPFSFETPSNMYVRRK